MFAIKHVCLMCVWHPSQPGQRCWAWGTMAMQSTGGNVPFQTVHVDGYAFPLQRTFIQFAFQEVLQMKFLLKRASKLSLLMLLSLLLVLCSVFTNETFRSFFVRNFYLFFFYLFRKRVVWIFDFFIIGVATTTKQLQWQIPTNPDKPDSSFFEYLVVGPRQIIINSD